MNEENSPLSLVNEEALKQGRILQTKNTLGEEIKLLCLAVERIDIFNLLLGINTNTALSKIQICQNVLVTNHEKLNEKRLDQINKKLLKMKLVIARKLKYGKKVTKYLEKKDDDLIYQIKSNLFEEDLTAYEGIRHKVKEFKDILLKKTIEIQNIYNKI